ncbi:MAG: DNA-binding GntR family transcriptional regulator [Paracoccaceae bacterium]
MPASRESGRKSDSPPQGEEAYRALLEEIRTGKLGPNDRLTETDIAARLKISRTPVREAIRLLESDGLVSHVPRVGAAVRSLDYSEIMELYDMRAVLEATAARLAARVASTVELQELAEINCEMSAALHLGADKLYELNRQFHLTLLDAAKNRFLSKAVNGLQKTLLILGPSTLEEAERAAEAQTEHDAIMAALLARDGAAAETAMRVHIEAAHRTRLRVLRARERSEEHV